MFKLESQSGKNYLIDPFFSMNPGCGDLATEEFTKSIDVVLLTHAHFDHTEGVNAFKDYNPNVQIIAQYELALLLMNEGFPNVMPLNFSGTLKTDDVSITMVPALHTSMYAELSDQAKYGGVAAGYVLEFTNDKTIYVSGDTGLTQEMKIISDLYQPQIALLSCSDVLTMGPREAEYAVRNLLDVDVVIPVHTFPNEKEAVRGDILKQLKEAFPIVEMMVGADQELAERLKDHKTKVVIFGFGETKIINC